MVYAESTIKLACPSRGKSPLYCDRVNGAIFQPDCNKWNCPVCGKRKKRKLFAQVCREFHGCRLRLWTFTIRHDPKIPVETWLEVYRNAWRRFVILWRKWESSKGGWRKCRFFRVTERTKAGCPHAHIIADRYVPWEKVGEFWATSLRYAKIKCGLSPHKISDGGIRLESKRDSVDPRFAARYVTKYVTKSFHVEHDREKPSRITRLYSSSRTIRLNRECPIVSKTKYQGLWERLPNRARLQRALCLLISRVMLPQDLYECLGLTGDSLPDDPLWRGNVPKQGVLFDYGKENSQNPSEVARHVEEVRKRSR